MRSISSTRRATWLSSDLPSTSRPSAGTTAGTFEDGVPGRRPGASACAIIQGHMHKLSPPWEGPFIIAQVLHPGAYKLKNEKSEVYANAWNIEQLRRFYPYPFFLRFSV